MDLNGWTIKFERIAAGYPRRQSALMPALQCLVEDEGGVPDTFVTMLSEACEVPPERVRELVEHYVPGRVPSCPRVRVCQGLVCQLHGSRTLLNALRQESESGPPDSAPAEGECTGHCHAAPVGQFADGTIRRLDPAAVAVTARR